MKILYCLCVTVILMPTVFGAPVVNNKENTHRINLITYFRECKHELKCEVGIDYCSCCDKKTKEEETKCCALLYALTLRSLEGDLDISIGDKNIRQMDEEIAIHMETVPGLGTALGMCRKNFYLDIAAPCTCSWFCYTFVACTIIIAVAIYILKVANKVRKVILCFLKQRYRLIIGTCIFCIVFLLYMLYMYIV